ncbi:MAG: hypothetical protein IRY87_15285 [Acetobacteraceae bacterium]|nr:hypothetical protein [Acetobacteraceae bacterium]
MKGLGAPIQATVGGNDRRGEYVTSRWVGQILANSSFLDSLAERSAGFDVRLWAEHEDDRPPAFFWASPHLDVLTDPILVRNRAAGLRALWHGVLYVVIGFDYSPLRVSSLSDEHNRLADIELGDPYTQPYAPELLGVGWRATFDARDPLANAVDLALALARYDHGSRDRLQALGIEGPTLTSLFRLYEDMTKVERWDDDRVDREGDAKAPVAKRFRGTVNNPFHSGAASRHGGPGSSPMAQTPVTLAEAAPVILKAYHRYLLARAASMDLAKLVS